MDVVSANPRQALTRPTKADWMRHEDTIKKLYLYNNMSIKQLSRISPGRFKFHATYVLHKKLYQFLWLQR